MLWAVGVTGTHIHRLIPAIGGVVAANLCGCHLPVQRADGRGAEQVATAGVATQVGANSQPEVIEAVAGLVLRLHKAAPQLKTVLQVLIHAATKAEQGVSVERALATQGEELAHTAQPIGSGNLSVVRVPKHQLQVVLVKPVDVTRQPRAFAHRSKGEFTQTADFPHRAGCSLHFAQVNLHAVRSAPEQFAGRYFLLQQHPVFGFGNGLHTPEDGRRIAGQTVDMAAKLARQCARRGRHGVVVFPGNRRSHARFNGIVRLMKHLANQPQGR